MAIVATIGFGGGSYLVYRYFTDGPFNRSIRLPLLFLFGLGVMGLYTLVDRGESDACDGMGRIEPDDSDDPDYDPTA